MKKEVVKKLLDLSADSYEKIAADFDASRKKEIWPEMRKFSEEVYDNDLVWDAGCGNGRLLEALINKKINYVGTDKSAALIALAKKNYPNYSFSVLDLLDKTKVELFLSGRKFQHIFCLAVLQHVPSKELRREALINLARGLAPEGQLVISNWNLLASKKRKLVLVAAIKKIFGLSKLDFGDIIFPWKDSQGEIKSERYYHTFTKKELENLAKLAGLKIKKSYQDKYNFWLLLSK